MKIIIADNNAWEKTVELEKAVVRLGSAATNDIQLASPNIAPVHLQFQYLPEEFGCHLLNLGNDVKIVRGEYDEPLRSYARTELNKGDQILLDSYRVRVQLPITTNVIQKSNAISASLSFPNTTLYANSPTIGWLTVKNIGDQSPSQFHVSVSGIQEDCIKIDPIPLLYAGAEEDVRIQLFHHGLYPYAGLAELNIRVFAPSDYPGEQVLVEQGIYVEPIFEQDLSFMDDRSTLIAEVEAPVNIPDPNKVAHSTTASVPGKVPPPLPPETVPTVPKEDDPIPVAVTTNQMDVEREMSIPVREPMTESPAMEKKEKVAVVVQEKPTPKRVVVRDVPDEFWDEDA